MRGSRATLLGLLLLFAIFTWFTWRGMTMFFSGDDMMNMFRAWDESAIRLLRGLVFTWEPSSRPLGQAVYRLFYSVFGFHPAPLYVFCWILLVCNLAISYPLLRFLTGSSTQSLTAIALWFVHGNYSDLYYSAGTIYDRLCFLFTAAALIAYFRFRESGRRLWFGAVCACAILALDSKESAIAVLPLLVFCELLYLTFPDGNRRAIRTGLPAAVLRSAREAGPLLATLTLISLLYVFGRVTRTPELTGNAAYKPHADLALWLSRMARYLGYLIYREDRVTPFAAALALTTTLIAALAARNRAVIFGWLFFVLTLTPVALIDVRPGYVLYQPALGAGLYFAAALALLLLPVQRTFPQADAVAFVLITVFAASFHSRHWISWEAHNSPEWRLTQQFRREYPSFPPRTRFLFASDDFPRMGFDLMFNLRMLYHDKSLVVHRLQAPPDQQPKPGKPWVYDHIFVVQSGHYNELEPASPAESIRLNIFRNVAVGREMAIANPDHSAYVVSGLRDVTSGEDYRWTEPRAKFKFRLPPGPATFTAQIYVAEFLVQSPARTLRVLVSGQEVGTFQMAATGVHNLRFDVPANLIQSSGFTFVDLNVEPSYKDSGGTEYGVVLQRAGFETAGSGS